MGSLVPGYHEQVQSEVYNYSLWTGSFVILASLQLYEQLYGIYFWLTLGSINLQVSATLVDNFSLY